MHLGNARWLVPSREILYVRKKRYFAPKISQNVKVHFKVLLYYKFVSIPYKCKVFLVILCNQDRTKQQIFFFRFILHFFYNTLMTSCWKWKTATFIIKQSFPTLNVLHRQNFVKLLLLNTCQDWLWENWSVVWTPLRIVGYIPMEL